LTATIVEVKVWTAFFWRCFGNFGSGACLTCASLDTVCSGTRCRSGDGWCVRWVVDDMLSLFLLELLSYRDVDDPDA
jgi:hypothetical protein